MLAEYGILPEVFGRRGEDDATLRLRMNALKRAFFDEGGCVARDPDDVWRKALEEMLDAGALGPEAKEVAKKLCKRCLRRLRLPGEWTVEERSQWVKLFNASFDVEKFDALLVKGALGSEVLMDVKDLDREAGRPLPGSDASMRFPRRLDEYKRRLQRVFAVSRELVFIDPYLDCRKNYCDFPQLLSAIPARPDQPRIKLHRQAKPNHEGNELWKQEWEDHFKPLSETLQQRGLKAEVFIWGKFHNRYLLHSFGGVLIAQGFDTNPAPENEEPATWCRMSPNACDDIRKEFSENSPYHNLCHRFEIGI